MPGNLSDNTGSSCHADRVGAGHCWGSWEDSRPALKQLKAEEKEVRRRDDTFQRSSLTLRVLAPVGVECLLTCRSWMPHPWPELGDLSHSWAQGLPCPEGPALSQSSRAEARLVLTCTLPREATNTTALCGAVHTVAASGHSAAPGIRCILRGSAGLDQPKPRGHDMLGLPHVFPVLQSSPSPMGVTALAGQDGRERGLLAPGYGRQGHLGFPGQGTTAHSSPQQPPGEMSPGRW